MRIRFLAYIRILASGESAKCKRGPESSPVCYLGADFEEGGVVGIPAQRRDKSVPSKIQSCAVPTVLVPKRLAREPMRY